MKNNQEPNFDIKNIKAIVGLGNPGQKYYRHRHSIGFRILDAMAEGFGSSGWQHSDKMETTTIFLPGFDEHRQSILLIKPTTYMNDSGKVFPWLQKKGIKSDQIVVVHDELEKPFGKHILRLGGSHRGHNGLRSIIDMIGKDFWRLRFGVGRPDDKQEVPNYVLSNFPSHQEAQLPLMINQVITLMTRV